MTPPLPRSTLFPYTTLFRSSTQRRARERSVAIQTLLLVRKSKSSSVKSKTAEADRKSVVLGKECRSRGWPHHKRKKEHQGDTRDESVRDGNGRHQDLKQAG